jgi:hypothetical protein
MAGTVYSYASTTLVIAVTSYAGSTKADWVFSAPTGQQGPQGIQGIQGDQGAQGSCYMSALIAGPDTTKTITGATHGLGNAALMVTVYDNSSPRNVILVGWSVDATSFDVLITFAVAQSNYYVIIASGIPETGGLPGGTGIVKVTDGTPSLATINTDFMGPQAGTGLVAVLSGAPRIATPSVDYQLPLSYTPMDAASKGAVSGVCPLDSSSKVPLANIPSNLTGDYNANSYNWTGMYTTATSPSSGGNLSIGSNTITITYCPVGVNGNDVNHTIRINDTVGTSETVTIIGGTARSGVTGSQTLIFTCAHTHAAGQWTLESAAMGIEEAVVVAIAAAYSGGYPYLHGPGVVIRIPGDVWVYGTIYVPQGGAVKFQGDPSTILECRCATNVPVFDCDSPCIFRDISMGPGTPQVSGGCAIRFGNGPTGGGVSVFEPVIENCSFTAGFYDCIVSKNTHNIKSTNNYAVNFVNTFISPSSGGDMCSLTSTNDTTVSIGMGSPAFASVYYTSGWVIISNPQFGSGVNNNQIRKGVKGYITGTSSSGTSIIGGAIAYFTESGFELEVHGSGVFYQFVTISGCNIHGEDTNIANTMVKFVLSGGATGIRNVTVAANTLQGGGSSATGIDLTGVTGTVTVGLNDISLVGTRVVGYTGPPAYANNAAALAGGLSVGDVYRISSTDTMGIVH